MPTVRFCEIGGCMELTVKDARSDTHCRNHYRDVVLADVELVKFEVTAPRVFSGGQWRTPRVVDARTGESIPAPGVVELDPMGTNIPALIAAGLGRVVPGPAADAVKAAANKKG